MDSLQKTNRSFSRLLAIETSCDDTSIAIVSFGEYGTLDVERCLLSSQVDLHAKYNGVVPELAARDHATTIHAVLEELGGKAALEGCDGIVVTASPGLPGALAVGISFAHALGVLTSLPVIEADHILGHIVSSLLDRRADSRALPHLVLTVSGGHNEIYCIHDGTLDTNELLALGGMDTDTQIRHKRYHRGVGSTGTLGPWTYVKLAQSIDDAAGEVYDKIARTLGGPYPGGRRISEQAQQWKTSDGARLPLPHMPAPVVAHGQYSLSGLKSHCFRMIDADTFDTDNAQAVQAFAYTFQQAINDTLVRGMTYWSNRIKPASRGLVGGVSANSDLRERCTEAFDGTLHIPAKMLYCTDNAAMIGGLGLVMTG